MYVSDGTGSVVFACVIAAGEACLDTQFHQLSPLILRSLRLCLASWYAI